MTDAADAIAIGRQIFDSFNRGDLATVAEFLDPGVVAEFPFSPPGVVENSVGREALLNSMAQARGMMTRIEIIVTGAYWAAADSILVVEARGEAELHGGAPYNNRYIFVLGFRDGRVILWREHFDSFLLHGAVTAAMA